MESYMSSKDFPETRNLVGQLHDMLKCCRCSTTELNDVYVLGNCRHIYCGNCKVVMAGKSCVTCGLASDAKDAKKDLWMNNLLTELKKFETRLNSVGSGAHSLKTNGTVDYTLAAHVNKPHKETLEVVIPTHGNVSCEKAAETTLVEDKAGQKKSERKKVVERRKSVARPSNRRNSISTVTVATESAISANSTTSTLSTKTTPSAVSTKSTASTVPIKSTGLTSSTRSTRSLVANTSTRVNLPIKSTPSILSTSSVSSTGLKNTTLENSSKPVGVADETSDDEDFKAVSFNTGRDKSRKPLKTLKKVNSRPKPTTTAENIESDVYAFSSPERPSDQNMKKPPILSPNPTPNQAASGKFKKSWLGGDISFPSEKKESRLPSLETSVTNSRDETETDEEELFPPMLTQYGRKTNKMSTSFVDKSTTKILPKKGKDISATRSSYVTVKMNLMETETTDLPLVNSTKKRFRKRSNSIGSLVSNSSSTISSSSVSGRKINSKGETDLHIAARTGNLQKARMLIDAGTDVNYQDFAGWTPLHEAINGRKRGCSIDVVKLLCEANCNVNLTGLHQETALHEAARAGYTDIVSVLLYHGASPNIRNALGLLPRQVAKSVQIQELIDNAAAEEGGIIPPSQAVEDPAVFEAQLSKAVVYFAYSVSPDTVGQCRTVLKMKISTELRGDVTHLIFLPTDSSNFTGTGETRVRCSMEYLFGVVKGAWMLNSQWIDDSLNNRKFVGPKSYEITGCDLQSFPGCHFDNGDFAPKRSRISRELGNPGLLQGMSFYFYKQTGFFELTKKKLGLLVKSGDGCVTIREPTAESVDPLQNLTRFHAECDGKFALLSHMTLFDQKNEPQNKLNMEHVKSLRVNWLIESIGNFKLMDPNEYLNL